MSKFHLKPIIIWCICIVICGCASLKKSVPTLSAAQIEINKNLANDNILGLMDNYCCYPDYRDFLSDYIFNEIDYKDISYSELTTFAEYSQKDSVLCEGFDFVLQQHRQRVCENLAQMELSQMANYYRNHPDETIFLRPLFQENLISTLSQQDYRYVRDVYNSFSNTDLHPQIDSIYTELRSVVVPKIKQSIEDYSNSETQLLEELKTKTLQEISSYIEKGLPIVIEGGLDKINRGILEEIFSSQETDSLSIRDFFEYKVNKEVAQKHIAQLIYNNVNDFASTIAKCRYNIAEQLLSSPPQQNEFILQHTFSIENYNYSDINWSPIDKIQQIHEQVDWTSWGLTIVSMIPVAGVAFDIADLAYSIWSDNKKGKQINALLEQFAAEYSSMLNQNISENIDIIFNKLFQDLAITQNSFKISIYENF